MFARAFIMLICFLPSAGSCAERSPFLVNMPQNSNFRCVGIAGVAEALLEGKRQEGKLSNIDTLARDIHDNFTQFKPITYPARLMVRGKSVPIDDKLALAALSERVAELYKADYRRLSRTPDGIQQLRQAQENVVRTAGELDEIFADDPDKTVFFCCFGRRSFPDRTVKDTNHAVLIQSAANGTHVVYDPNDPGAAIACKLEQSDDGLVVSWQCQYRDQNVKTTQRYLIVPQQRYFKVLRTPVPGHRYALIRQSGPNRQTAQSPCPCEK